MARSGALWQRPAVAPLLLLCWLAAVPDARVDGATPPDAAPALLDDAPSVTPGNTPPGGNALADPLDSTSGAAPVGDPVGSAAPTEVSGARRVQAGAAAAIGGGAGGFVGGALALGLSAALSGVASSANLLPLVVLPPLFAGVGAWVVGGAIGGPTVGLAGGAGAGLLCVAWSVALGALVVSADQGLLAGRFDVTFAATALVPAVVGVVGAGLTAPWFASADGAE